MVDAPRLPSATMPAQCPVTIILPNLSQPQAIIYNHGLLGLWGSDRVVVVADLDEFLVTARPSQGVTQVCQACLCGLVVEVAVGQGAWQVQGTTRGEAPALTLVAHMHTVATQGAGAAA